MNSYSKTVWSNNEPPAINAENLNHIEDGIAAVNQAVTALETAKLNDAPGAVDESNLSFAPVKYVGSNDLDECINSGVLYRVHDGSAYQLVICSLGTNAKTQYMFTQRGTVKSRTMIGENAWSSWKEIATEDSLSALAAQINTALAAKLDDSAGSVKSANIDSGAVTENKLGADLYRRVKTWNYNKTGTGVKVSYYSASSLGLTGGVKYRLSVRVGTLAAGDGVTVTARSAGNLNASSLVRTICSEVDGDCDLFFELTAAEMAQTVYFAAHCKTSSAGDVSVSLSFYDGLIIEPAAQAYIGLGLESGETREKINGILETTKRSSLSKAAGETASTPVLRLTADWLGIAAGKNYRLRVSDCVLSGTDAIRIAFQSGESYSAPDRVKLVADRVTGSCDLFFNLTAAELAAADYLVFWTPESTANAVYASFELSQGELVDAESGINENGGRLSALEADAQGVRGINPYYFENDYLPSKINEIIDGRAFVDGVCFAFVTDMHITANSMQSLPILKYIREKAGVPLVLCGGDWSVAESATPEQTVKLCGRAAVNYAAEIGHFYGVQGNHDFFSRVSWADASAGYTAQDGEIYNYVTRPVEMYVEPHDRGYYCIDNEKQKTRYFMLNSCEAHSADRTTGEGTYYLFTKAQADWLIGKMSEKSGWNYIFVSHIPCDPDLDGYSGTQDALMEILKAAKNKRSLSYTWDQGTISHDFTGFDNNVICWIGGHCHKDLSHICDNVLSITATCDAHYRDDNWNAVAGTVSEQAIDVFCVDYDSGSISAVRIGRGQNRAWNI